MKQNTKILDKIMNDIKSKKLSIEDGSFLLSKAKLMVGDFMFKKVMREHFYANKYTDVRTKIMLMSRKKQTKEKTLQYNYRISSSKLLLIWSKDGKSFRHEHVDNNYLPAKLAEYRDAKVEVHNAIPMPNISARCFVRVTGNMNNIDYVIAIVSNGSADTQIIKCKNMKEVNSAYKKIFDPKKKYSIQGFCGCIK